MNYHSNIVPRTVNCNVCNKKNYCSYCLVFSIEFGDKCNLNEHVLVILFSIGTIEYNGRCDLHNI
jgi:hypothetical protein